MIEETNEPVENSLEDIVTAAVDGVDLEQSKPDGDEPAAIEPAAPAYEPPQSWRAEVKDKFGLLPPEVQQEILRREEEVHKGFTKHDEERTFGRQLKEVFTPYMAIIQAEGGRPEKIVQDYLNADYVLRTGSPEQKVGLLRAIAQQAGVDLASVAQEQEYVDPEIAALRQQIAELKAYASPQFVQQQLQQQNESARIDAEIQAFASAPENDLFEKVRPVMATLMNTGRYSNLKEAYEAAVHADPECRQIVMQRQQAAEQERRKSTVAAKRNAGSSISGSPAVSGNAIPPKGSLEEIATAAYDAVVGNNHI